MKYMIRKEVVYSDGSVAWCIYSKKWWHMFYSFRGLSFTKEEAIQKVAKLKLPDPDPEVIYL